MDSGAVLGRFSVAVEEVKLGFRGLGLRWHFRVLQAPLCKFLITEEFFFLSAFTLLAQN